MSKIVDEQKMRESMSSGILLYHQDQNCLELNGIILRCGERIEVRILGNWVFGQLNQDSTGWYLITSDKIEIRLQSRLAARFPDISFPPRLFDEHPVRGVQPLEGADRKLILLVEDDKSHGSMLYEIFKQETPYRVHAAADGQTAWNFLHHVKPNLILLDYLLPRMNGLVLYDCICREKVLQDIPVLMISAALPSDEIKKRGLLGLQKPFEIETFLQMIETLIT